MKALLHGSTQEEFRNGQTVNYSERSKRSFVQSRVICGQLYTEMVNEVSVRVTGR